MIQLSSVGDIQTIQASNVHPIWQTASWTINGNISTIIKDVNITAPGVYGFRIYRYGYCPDGRDVTTKLSFTNAGRDIPYEVTRISYNLAAWDHGHHYEVYKTLVPLQTGAFRITWPGIVTNGASQHILEYIGFVHVT